MALFDLNLCNVPPTHKAYGNDTVPRLSAIWSARHTLSADEAFQVVLAFRPSRRPSLWRGDTMQSDWKPQNTYCVAVSYGCRPAYVWWRLSCDWWHQGKHERGDYKAHVCFSVLPART